MMESSVIQNDFHMKNRTIVLVLSVSAVVFVASSVSYFMLTPRASTKAKPSAVGQPAGEVVTPAESRTPSTTETAAPLSIQNAKRYANPVYGFSFLMPKEYWYEEMTIPETGDGFPSPVFSVLVEHPALPSISVPTPSGSTMMSKYGVLFSVDVYPLDHGTAAPSGMDHRSAVPASVGGLNGIRYDDRGYSVAGKSYSYYVGRYPSDSGTNDSEAMKAAFEEVVRTFRFE